MRVTLNLIEVLQPHSPAPARRGCAEGLEPMPRSTMFRPNPNVGTAQQLALLRLPSVPAPPRLELSMGVCGANPLSKKWQKKSSRLLQRNRMNLRGICGIK